MGCTPFQKGRCALRRDPPADLHSAREGLECRQGLGSVRRIGVRRFRLPGRAVQQG